MKIKIIILMILVILLAGCKYSVYILQGEQYQRPFKEKDHDRNIPKNPHNDKEHYYGLCNL